MKSKAVLGTIALCVCSPLRAQHTGEAARATLAGLSSIRVFVIEQPGPDPKTRADESVIEEAVERTLLAYDVPLVADDSEPPLGQVTITIVHTCAPVNRCASHVSLAVEQRVMLTRDPTISGYAATWESGVIGPMHIQSAQESAEEASQEIRTVLNNLVTQFANAYRAANPKRGKSQ